MGISQARLEELEAGAPPQNQEEADTLANDRAGKEAIAKYGANQASTGRNDPTQAGKILMPGIDDRPGGLWKPTVGYYGGHRGAAEEEEKRYEGLAGAADQRTGPQMQLGNYNASRLAELAGSADQRQALGLQQGLITGQGPSVAAIDQQRGLLAANQQAAQGMANVRGGGANMIAAQNAGIGYGGMGAAGAVNAGGQARFAEQAGHLNAYGGLANAYRGQGLQRADQSMQTSFQQAGLEAQQRALNDARNSAYEHMRQGVFQDQMGAQQWAEGAAHGQFEADRSLAEQRAARENAERQAYITGATGGLAAGGGLLASMNRKDK